MKLTDSRYSFKNLADKAKRSVLSVLRRKPDFLIAGTQKRGTTSLYAYLKEHLQVPTSTGPRELHFFNMYVHKDDLLVLDYQDMSSNLHRFLKQIWDFLGNDEFTREKCDKL
ncbi:hypothetical protein [Alteromonas lipotrueiana]|uniref:hypothetical protein n=1 Tax=Alteromonas lipotrueiana TaxID=2803815 RepID=UPI001C477505|nr:hypothetical protein [Alteromonas lipotrueiana]